MKKTFSLVLFLFLFLDCARLFGQVPSIVPAQPMENHGIYSINLQDMSVVINVPVRQKPEFSAVFNGSLNNVGYTTSGSSNYISPFEVGLTTGGSVNGVLGANTTVQSSQEYSILCPDGITTTYKFAGWYFRDANGTVHPLPSTDYIDNEALDGSGKHCYQSNFIDQTTDYVARINIFTAVSLGHANVYMHNGNSLTANFTLPSSSNEAYGTTGFTSYTDKNGNTVSANGITFTSYTDVMAGITPLTSTGTSGAPTYSWTDINGGTQQTKITTGSFKRKTSYGCGPSYKDITDTTAIPLMTGVTFPDSTFSMFYEANGSGYTTGRIASMTLPTGGTVSFAYSGFNCTYLQVTQMTVTTSDGTWTYSWAPVISGSSGNTTTVQDPAGNRTVYSFIGAILGPNVYGSQGDVMTQVQTFHYGSSTADITTLYCRNGNTSNCLTTVPTQPVTQVDTYTTLAGMSSQHSIQMLDVYGNTLTEQDYDYNGTTYYKFTGTYSGCGQSANLYGLLCTSVVSSNTSNEIFGTTNTYDSAGDLLTTNAYLPGNTTLTTTNTYNSNGTLATATNASGVKTTFAYGDCNGFAPTQTTVNSLSTSKTYGTAGCDGGVPVTATDANGNVTHFGYANVSTGAADPYYRLMSTTNPQSNVTTHYYNPLYREDGMSFASSELAITTEFDGYGRVLRTQKQQGPGSSNYDTVSYTYSQSTTGGLGARRTSSVPCTAAGNVDCTVGLTTTQFDYLGRPLTITDGGTGVRTFTYNQNDVEGTLSPAPSGENTKSFLAETNGLGMNTIMCPIVTTTLPAGSSCGANTAGTGYPITTALTTGTGTFTTTSTLVSQTKTKVFDALGRITSESYPELNGSTNTYTYDSATGCSGTQNGKLAKEVDAKGNVLCYSYDSYGRLTQVSANGTSCHLYFYDNSQGFSGTIPSGWGISISNALGHIVEAATSNCLTTLITDEWFSYDSLGRLTDTWEMTPHSTVNGTHVYYHVNESYFANGAPNVETFTGIDANNTVVTYGIDGEGRWTTAEIGAANEVIGVTYNAAQQPTVISFATGAVNTTTSAIITAPGGGPLCHNSWNSACTFTVTSATNIVPNQMLLVDGNCQTCFPPTFNQESVQVESVSGTTVSIKWPGFMQNHAAGVPVVSQNGGDKDTYTYNSATGRMATFNILSNESAGSLNGTMTWSADGTLGSMVITDGFNAGGTQTCAFAYDDLARIASDLCGTGSTNYRSTMTYNQYDNITKSSSNGTAPTWPISGSYSNTTNRLSSSTYDNNGSTLTDYFHTYQWDGFNRMSTLDTSTMTYDALGKVVEVANGGVYTVFQYTPIGSKIVWNQSNEWTRGHLPMPGGTSLDWTPTATYMHHKDWLGSSRITTTAGAVYTDKAFGAYGEDTVQDFGPATNFNFTGDSQDIATAVYDTPNREYMPYQGRWPNVDPTHSGWNLYAYVENNPLSFTDPLGLFSSCPPGSGPGTVNPDGTTNCGPPPNPGSPCFFDNTTQSLNCGGTIYPGCVAQGTEGCIPPPCSTPGDCSSSPGGSSGSQAANNGCVQPSKVQSAIIPVVATAASFWNKTLLFGLGASGGAGLGKGFGFYGGGTVQIAVSPSGAAAYVITYAAPGATYYWLTPSTKGAGILFGSQFGFSNATDPSQLAGPGVDASGSLAAGLGIGADSSLSIGGNFPYQFNVTLGFGAGGRGSAGAVTNTIVIPICKN